MEKLSPPLRNTYDVDLLNRDYRLNVRWILLLTLDNPGNTPQVFIGQYGDESLMVDALHLLYYVQPFATSSYFLYPERERSLTWILKAQRCRQRLYTQRWLWLCKGRGQHPSLWCCVYRRVDCGEAQLAWSELFHFSLHWPWPACGLGFTVSFSMLHHFCLSSSTLPPLLTPPPPPLTPPPLSPHQLPDLTTQTLTASQERTRRGRGGGWWCYRDRKQRRWD